MASDPIWGGNPNFQGFPWFTIRSGLVPTILTEVVDFDFLLFKLEIANNTGGAITFSAFDGQPLILIPPVSIANTNVLTYLDGQGRDMFGGLSWQASAPGLVGYIKGAKLV